jgi:hypothetical protein
MKIAFKKSPYQFSWSQTPGSLWRCQKASPPWAQVSACLPAQTHSQVVDCSTAGGRLKISIRITDRRKVKDQQDDKQGRKEDV